LHVGRSDSVFFLNLTVRSPLWTYNHHFCIRGCSVRISVSVAITAMAIVNRVLALMTWSYMKWQLWL